MYKCLLILLPIALLVTLVMAQVQQQVQQVQIRVDVRRERHPISPQVYGVNFADAAAAKALNLAVNRNGGNAATRYNWKLNATSSGSDWFFMSHGEQNGGATPSGTIDAFIRANRSAGTKSMITIPLIGWTAKLAPNREALVSFSVNKYGPQKKTEQWHPDFGNGEMPDGKPITGNDPNDANMPVTPDFYQDWIKHLTETFGTAKQGGVSCYLLDNEAGLWHATHRDVFPIGFKMDDYAARALKTAAMIKSVDPTAMVAGPEEWGWIGYIYSGYDSQWAGINGYSKPRPDRMTHGDMDFSPWLLQQFAGEQKRTGKRLLDVFTLHYYPQSDKVNTNDNAPQTQLLRMRCTRSLWDRNYTDESWIKQKIYLIPRMKDWVRTYYPGTKIGVTEYNFGGEDSINGGIAQADVLGIFGREGVDIATRWVCPAVNTPAFRAIQLFRNYDGKKSTFGDTSVHCEANTNPDNVVAFAAQDSKTGKVTVVVLNKQLTATTNISLSVAGLTRKVTTVQAYQLSGNDPIKPLASLTPKRDSVTMSLPPQSATLLLY